MLVALLTILFLGGGSSNAVLAYVAESKPLVKEAVVDEVRQVEALATLKAMKSEQKDYGKLVKATVKELKAELQAGSADTIDAVWQDYFAAKQASDEKMIDLRFQLRDQLTRDEWEAVYSSE